METRYLQTLVTAVETGSFSRTAEILHITQSAVSQRVKFLEESFGQQLIDRSGPTLKPSEAGRLILDRAREIVALERGMRDDLRLFGREKRLAICCTPTFGMAFLPQVLNDFMRSHNDLDDFTFLFQQPEAALRGLQEQQYDVAIIEHCDTFDSGSFAPIALQADELVFVAAPQLNLPAGESTLAELIDYRLYARRDGCSSKELLQRNLAAAGFGIDDFAGVVVSDDLRLTLEAVTAGLGISFVSRDLVRDQIAAGTLVACRVQGFRHRRCRTLLSGLRPGREGLVDAFRQSVCRVMNASSCHC